MINILKTNKAGPNQTKFTENEMLWSFPITVATTQQSVNVSAVIASCVQVVEQYDRLENLTLKTKTEKLEKYWKFDVFEAFKIFWNLHWLLLFRIAF